MDFRRNSSEQPFRRACWACYCVLLLDCALAKLALTAGDIHQRMPSFPPHTSTTIRSQGRKTDLTGSAVAKINTGVVDRMPEGLLHLCAAIFVEWKVHGPVTRRVVICRVKHT